MKRGTPEHPKTTRLMGILGIPRYQAVGILESIWHFTTRYATLGDIGKWTDEEIASAIGWEGDAHILISAMVTARFLDERQDCRLSVHDWNEHADEATKKYVVRTQKQFVGTCPDISGHFTPAVAVAVAEAVADPEPEPEPEETDSPEPAKPASVQPPAVLTFPTVGKTHEWGLTEAKVAEYQEAFPGIDVLAECRKARQWCIDNPARRKTARGMGKFLFGWIERTQNRGGSSGQARGREADRRGGGEFGTGRQGVPARPGAATAADLDALPD